MATSSLKSQRLKRWILLLASVIAAAIWIRNLFVLFPKGATEIAVPENQPMRPARVRRTPLPVSAFDDTSSWIDPFAPPETKGGSKVPGLPGKEKRVLPKAPPEPPPWKLAGVVWDRKSPAAILASLTDNHRVVVAKGDTLGPSRIEKIDQTNVWIHHNGRSWKLALDESDSTGSH
jgi:hypothetical protein